MSDLAYSIFAVLVIFSLLALVAFWALKGNKS